MSIRFTYTDDSSDVYIRLNNEMETAGGLTPDKCSGVKEKDRRSARDRLKDKNREEREQQNVNLYGQSEIMQPGN